MNNSNEATVNITSSHGTATINHLGATISYEIDEDKRAEDDMFAIVKKYDIEDYLLFWQLKDINELEEIYILEIGGI